MFKAYTAIFDSCVLFPAQLRNFLMRLSMSDLFRAKWTADIHEEWMAHAQAKYPDRTRQDWEKIRDLMDSHVLDALVTGYESLIDALSLPDPDDRHVLAAAIRCGADVIVTFNLADFPEDVLSVYDVTAQHPDDFVAHQFTLNAGAVCFAARQHRASLRNPAFSPLEYLDILQRAGLPKTAAVLSSAGYRELI